MIDDVTAKCLSHRRPEVSPRGDIDASPPTRRDVNHLRRPLPVHVAVASFGNPWDDRVRFRTAGKTALRLYERVLHTLAGYLNQVHGKRYSLRYWRILVGPWLIHFVSAFFDRFIRVRRMLPNVSLNDFALIDRRSFATPFDAYDFLDLAYERYADLYNAQLYSQIIDALGLGRQVSTNRSRFNWSDRKPRPASPREKVSTSVLSVAEATFNRLSGRSSPEIMLQGQISLRDAIRIRQRSSRRIGLYPYAFPRNWRFHPDMQSESRSAIGALNGHSLIEQTLFAVLPENLPSIFIEGYDRSREHALSAPRCARPRVICSFGGLWYNEMAQYYAAEATEHGSRLIMSQIGSGYGISNHSEIEAHERRIADRFFCWGWSTLDGDPKLKNVPAIKLSRRLSTKPRRSTRKTKILFCSNAHPRYLIRFHSFPVSTQWQAFFSDTVTFIKRLPPRLIGNLSFRIYRVDYGWRQREMLQTTFPKLDIDDGAQPFAKSARQAKVVVCDHPGTIMLETLSWNVPTIVFFNPRYWEMRPYAQTHLDGLRRAGILFNTPTDAARQLQAVYHRASDWWASDSVQSAASNFTRDFAMSRPDWAEIWADSLSRETRAATPPPGIPHAD